MTTTFEYLGRKFAPLGALVNHDFHEITRLCRSIGINNYNDGKWNHNDFYQNAMCVGAGRADVFLMDGKKKVLPCENELFAYSGLYRAVEEIKKPFLLTVHLLLEATDSKHAEDIASECLQPLYQSQVIRDWHYAKDINNWCIGPLQLEHVDLSSYEDNEAFEDVVCTISIQK